ncbi:hypothetical protein EPN95_02025 [Patescibacteria group bacterium]|nr:MAG: hypothetical protein EPN95_02025 [Patescibacteria group bacterium]
MDSNPQLVKPISDDQELAKVLAGVSQHNDTALQFDTPPAVTPTTPAVTPVADPDPVATSAEPTDTAEPETASTLPTPDDALPNGYNPPLSSTLSTPTSPVAPAAEPSNDLSDIKKEALSDLRPLVDKLDIPSEEKFDTYLLLIRSTDDKSLIAPAYAAAQAITDEARKAQALLDVIKEIDYLSNPQK